MGTRGLVGFQKNGQVKTSYVHMDAYPSGVGIDVLEWVRIITSLDPDLDGLGEAVDALVLVDQDEMPSHTELRKLKQAGLRPSEDEEWYGVLRGVQGDLRAALALGFMVDSNKFGHDSLFCEWGYVLNLDTRTLDLYKGFQESDHTDGWWATHPDPEAHVASSYRSIRRIRSYSLDDLPSESKFVAIEETD